MYYAMANGIEMIMMYFYYWMDKMESSRLFERKQVDIKIEHLQSRNIFDLLALQHEVDPSLTNWH